MTILEERQKKLLKAQARQIAAFDDRLARRDLAIRVERDEKRRLQRELAKQKKAFEIQQERHDRVVSTYQKVLNQRLGEILDLRQRLEDVLGKIAVASTAQRRLEELVTLVRPHPDVERGMRA